MHDVLRARSFNRLLLRRRRTTALLGTILVLGVVGLNAHAALPEHHDTPGHATMCIAALSIAILAAAGLATRSLTAPASPLYSVRLAPLRSRIPAGPASSNARAGPAVSIVLRR
jgi:hypothetical protein